jgi:hypothetical protein
MNLFVNFFDRVKQAYYTGYFTSDNEPDGIKNATHNTLVKRDFLDGVCYKVTKVYSKITKPPPVVLCKVHSFCIELFKVK